MNKIELKADMTMGDILANYPSGQRALFQKYHIGGCSSCGFSNDQTLEEVMGNHGKAEQSQEAIDWIYESAKVDEAMQITPDKVKEEIANGVSWTLVDIREEYEMESGMIENALVGSREYYGQIMNEMPKDSNILFYCATGQRSLEAASYFKGHGLQNVKSLQGGIEAWNQAGVLS